MNTQLIKKQLEEINPPEVNIKQNVLHQIRVRRQKRRKNIRISAAIFLVVVIIATIQSNQIVVMAENLYRNIKISLSNETLIINDYLEIIPIEVRGLSWVGTQPNRVGTKHYSDVDALENELKINLLQNTMSYESKHQRQIPFLYFEEQNMAQLLFHDLFIGDLKDYSETNSENGGIETFYNVDHDSIYKSPVSMSVMFFTDSGANYKNDNWEIYDYEEKYISPINGITAYLLTDKFQVKSGDEKRLMYVAGSVTDKVSVFVHDNLYYTISGNIPASEMKKIIDSFVIK